MLPKRLEKLGRMVALRQIDLTVCLENVHDPHNISAVMRSCDSVGIGEIYIIHSDPALVDRPFLPGKKSASGSNKWVKVNVYTNAETCFAAMRQNHQRILATSLHAESEDLYTLDLSQSLALVFGNERDGVSEKVRSLCDGNFTIPHVGMVPSLNISVACAVSLYEALRQRMVKGMYDVPPKLSPKKREILAQFVDLHLKNSRL